MNNPVINSYEVFAKFYDPLGFNLFSLLITPYLEENLYRLEFRGKEVLDMACGTGSTAIWFHQRGYAVTGVDISPHMLAEARKKIKQAKAEIPLLKKDMRYLSFKNEFDLTVCLFDSLNHILEYEDIVKIFKGVYKALRPGGFFMFDMVTPYELSSQWNDSIRKEANGNMSLTLTSRYDKETRTARLTGDFAVNNDGKEEHYVQSFQEKAWMRKEIKKALKESGLTFIENFRCFSFSQPTSKSYRIFYIARKQD
jgi:ubiquinone/menaquinone biosynthesis C-methylase UbiE